VISHFKNFLQILIIFIYILFPCQAVTKNWTPNQIGAFLSSKMARENADIEAAAYYAKFAYNRNTESNGLALIALETLTANGQINEAINISSKIANKIPEISVVQYLQSLKFIKSNDYSAVTEIFNNITPTGIDNYILPILQTWAATSNNKHTEGLEIIQNEANKGILTPIYDYHAALIYEYMGDDEAALKHYQNVINKANTANAKVYITAALFFEKIGKNNLKLETLNKLEQLDPYSNELLILKNTKSLPTPNMIFSPKDGIAEIFLNSAELLYNEGLNMQALTFVQMAKYLNSNIDECNYLLGRIFRTINNNERSLKYFNNISNNSYASYDATIAIAEMKYAIEGINSSINYLNNIIANQPKNINFSRTMAELYYKEEDYNNSIIIYNKIIDDINNLEFKHWPLLYSTAIALERGNQWEKAEKYFLLTLQFVPDNPQVLNYLGYSWIDQGVHIDKALSMIKKAVEQRPNDGYIIDSLGWAYYQIGKYEEAVEQLEKASQLLSDVIIIDHLGDALFYTGRKIEALFQWQRALKFNPSQELKVIIQDKIDGKITPKSGVNAESEPI